MLQLLLAAALALAAAPALRPFPVPAQCLSADSLQSTLSADLPQARLMGLPEEMVARFLTAFNALPPRTDARADGVLIITMPDAPQAAIAFFQRGCLVGRASLPLPLLEALLRKMAEEA